MQVQHVCHARQFYHHHRGGEEVKREVICNKEGERKRQEQVGCDLVICYTESATFLLPAHRQRPGLGRLCYFGGVAQW